MIDNGYQILVWNFGKQVSDQALDILLGLYRR